MTAAATMPVTTPRRRYAGQTSDELRDVSDTIASPGEASSSLEQFDTGLENVYADEATADKINREAAEPAGMKDSGWQLSSHRAVAAAAALTATWPSMPRWPAKPPCRIT
jgi:hypothetical protein